MCKADFALFTQTTNTACFAPEENPTATAAVFKVKWMEQTATQRYVD